MLLVAVPGCQWKLSHFAREAGGLFTLLNVNHPLIDHCVYSLFCFLASFSFLQFNFCIGRGVSGSVCLSGFQEGGYQKEYGIHQSIHELLT